MASLAKEFSAALAGEFQQANATNLVPNSSVASASGEGILQIGRGVVYGLAFSITGLNTAIDWRLVDASATGVQTPVIFALKSVGPAGMGALIFPRPIPYTNGLCWHTSATGAAQPQFTLHWSPVGTL